MALQEQIISEIKEAMKAGNTEKLGVLRMLNSAMKNKAIEKGRMPPSLMKRRCR